MVQAKQNEVTSRSGSQRGIDAKRHRVLVIVVAAVTIVEIYKNTKIENNIYLHIQ